MVGWLEVCHGDVLPAAEIRSGGSMLVVTYGRWGTSGAEAARKNCYGEVW